MASGTIILSKEELQFAADIFEDALAHWVPDNSPKDEIIVTRLEGLKNRFRAVADSIRGD